MQVYPQVPPFPPGPSSVTLLLTPPPRRAAGKSAAACLVISTLHCPAPVAAVVTCMGWRAAAPVPRAAPHTPLAGARAAGPARLAVARAAGPARSAAHAFGGRCAGLSLGPAAWRAAAAEPRRSRAQRRTRLRRPGAWQESAPPPSSPPPRRNFQLYVSIYSCFVH